MNWFRQLFLRKRLYGDLSEEMQQHLEERAAELMQRGISREDAEAAARREFGNALVLEERGRQVWIWSGPEAILRDARFALRQLRRTPGFTFTVLLILTLAIGANTAVFSMVNALLLRPLPYPHPDRLASLNRRVTGVMPGGRFVEEIDDSQDGETFELVRDRVPSVMIAALSGSNGVNLEADRQVRYVQDHRISAGFFNVLGIPPLLGRNFTEEEDRPHGPNTTILSYALWQSLFSGDEKIIGQAIRLKGEPYTVVGVMPPYVQDTTAADLWTPLRPARGGEGGGDNYGVIMRLRGDATWAQVNSQLLPLRPSLFDQMFKGAKSELFAMPLQRSLAMEKRNATLMLMSAVGMILLIAAVNLAALILVRTSRRRDEIATRLALGAPRSAILRQQFTEPLLLSAVGAGGGAALAFFGLKAFVGLFPKDMQPLGGMAIDGRVLAFTLLSAACVSLFTGIFPALATRHVRMVPSLSGRTAGEAGSGRTRKILIGCEMALTLVLLAGAGLLVRTLVHLETLPAGFDPNGVMTAKASLDDARYHNPAAFRSLVRESLAAMKRIPGVESAAVGLSLPYERGLNDGFKVLDGPRANTQMASSTAYVSPEYFRALGIPILAGREFTDVDTEKSEPVAMVSESFARTHMGTLDVIGLHLGLGKKSCRVIGLVGNVKKRPGIVVTAPLATEPMYYVPYTQVDEGFLKLVHVWFQPSWLVRARGPLAGLPEAMQRALAEADPRLPFSGFFEMNDLEALALSEQRVEVLLLTVLAGLALLLSVVGIYGLVSNIVVERRREIGIRMALGCQLGQAMRTVAGSGIIAASVGLGGGLLLSLFVLRLLKSQLFGVGSLDPATLIVASLALLLATVIASYLPARRIVRIDPAATLRAE
jgi:predicted permease